MIRDKVANMIASNVSGKSAWDELSFRCTIDEFDDIWDAVVASGWKYLCDGSTFEKRNSNGYQVTLRIDVVQGWLINHQPQQS